MESHLKVSKRKKLAVSLGIAAVGTLAAVATGNNAVVAKANPRPTECYRIPDAGSPFASEETTETSEVWCYKELEEPQGARLIYNIDGHGITRPELSLMVEADGTMRHASLSAGKLTFHRLQAEDFNPIGAPLVPPPDAERVPEPISPSSTESVDKNIQAFQEYGDIKVRASKITEGKASATVPQESMPWRGYWFPYSTSRMHKGESAPLAKYDKFISYRAADTNPGAQAWEKKRHAHGFAWSGHCNGWAAASVMAKEPTKPITDPFSGLTFSISDQKALWIERHYCPKIVFYGSRNYGRPGDNPLDIAPSTFHNVLTYFIGELKKPVLMDYMATRPVENSVVSGYTMKTNKIDANTFYVETTLRIHLYDKDLTEETGVARSFTKTYKYYLTTNNAGFVLSGTWASPNPDFFWVPLAPGDCKDKNQVVDGFWLDEIYRVSKPAN